MKTAREYQIKNNILTANISKGLKTNYDWFLEITTNCGGNLIGEFKKIHLTKKSAIAEFNNFRSKGYLIKVI
jgi:hypothetical protein